MMSGTAIFPSLVVRESLNAESKSTRQNIVKKLDKEFLKCYYSKAFNPQMREWWNWQTR